MGQKKNAFVICMETYVGKFSVKPFTLCGLSLKGNLLPLSLLPPRKGGGCDVVENKPGSGATWSWLLMFALPFISCLTLGKPL